MQSFYIMLNMVSWLLYLFCSVTLTLQQRHGDGGLLHTGHD